MGNAPILQVADLLLTCEETTDMASVRGSPREYMPSAMTTAQFTEANVGAASVGQIVIPMNGDARGVPRMIKSISGTDAILDKAYASVTGVTRIAAYRPAVRPFRITTQGNVGGTTHLSADHATLTNEPDDHWNDKGYFLIFLTGANAGRAGKVEDFASATGTITTRTGDLVQDAVNDLAILAKMLLPEPDSLSAEAAPNLIRRRAVGFIDAQHPVKGIYNGSIGFELPQKQLPAVASDGVAAKPPVEASDLLADVLVPTFDTGSVVVSAAGNDLTVSAGDGAGFTIGGFVKLATGEVGHIRSKATDVLTLGASHMTAAKVVAATAVHAAAHYRRRVNGQRTRSFFYFRGGEELQWLEGCGLNQLQILVARDNMVRLKFQYAGGILREYTLDRWVAADATFPIVGDNTIANDAKHSRFMLDGTVVCADNIEIDLNFEAVERPCAGGENQRNGYAIIPKSIVSRFTILADEDKTASFEDLIDRLQTRDFFDILWYKESCAFDMPAAVLTKAAWNYKDGQGHYDCEVEAIEPSLAPGGTFNAGVKALHLGFFG